MGVREDGLVVGSVSGGCVEGAVIEASLACLVSGNARILDFGQLSDESVWEVGLSCGGRIKVLVDPNVQKGEPWKRICELILVDQEGVLVTEIAGAEMWVWTPEDGTGCKLKELADEALRSGESRLVEVNGVEYFLQVFPRRDRLIVIGAVHIAIPLIKFAKILGLETVLIDPRETLANSERFPDPPDSILCAWPDKAFENLKLGERDYAVVLTHDPKIDDGALELLLNSPVAYIGALGSRTTQAKRKGELAGRGFSEDQIRRIHGPVGLPIGGRSPEEIALSIMAEIIQVRNAKC